MKSKYNTLRLIAVTPVQKNPFLQLRKALCRTLKNKSVKKVKEYDNVTQMRNEYSDYGDLPRSK